MAAIPKLFLCHSRGVYGNGTGNRQWHNLRKLRYNWVSELPKLRLAAITGPTACTSADGSIVLTPTPGGNYQYDWTRPTGNLEG